MPNSTMIGFGITMEGINQNYAVYEFALERGWDQLTVPADKWFDKYALTRYGRASKQLQTALQHLRVSIFLPRFRLGPIFMRLCTISD